MIAAIYKRATGDQGGAFDWLTRRDRARYFSRELAALWNAADKRTAKGDQNPPGFDPVTESQDPMVKNPRVAVKARRKDTAVVAATFSSWGEPPERVTVLYDMRRDAAAGSSTTSAAPSTARNGRSNRSCATGRGKARQ
jgi:hypothetical protein